MSQGFSREKLMAWSYRPARLLAYACGTQISASSQVNRLKYMPIARIEPCDYRTPMRYRRHYQTGGCYFFTVVTAGRRPWLRHEKHVGLLREAFAHVRARHPFAIDAIVVLPDHLHALWTMPETDANYSLRWRLIKTYVSKRLDVSAPAWQPRFWEHAIRDDNDYARHMDYIHYNPVKHGRAQTPADWPHSSFMSCVRRGLYMPDWGRVSPDIPVGIGHE